MPRLHETIAPHIKARKLATTAQVKADLAYKPESHITRTTRTDRYGQRWEDVEERASTRKNAPVVMWYKRILED